MDQPNSHSVTSSWPSDNSVTHHDGNSDNHPPPGFPNNVHQCQQHFSDHQQHQNFCSEPNVSNGHTNSLPLSGLKRPFSHSSRGPPPDLNDGVSSVKLYARGLPRTVTQQDIGSFFGQYGSIVEVVLLRDKKSGQQQECCFVKYENVEEAERAIGALHNRQTFPGGMGPIELKYAVGEQERIGFLRQQCKLYVGGLNKKASKEEIAQIFSPYGCVVDVFQLRDEMKQNRGLAFIQFTHREMAVAAMAALNGQYVMNGCDVPLVVRFADPKKPKAGEPRHTPFFRDSMGQSMLPNTSHMSSKTGSQLPTVPSHSPSVTSSTEMADPPDCDWSEHICPDGNEYYYNCVTCESRWEKPEEYRFYEQQVQNCQQGHHPQSQFLDTRSDPQVHLTHHAPQIPQELDRVLVQAVTYYHVVGSACGCIIFTGILGERHDHVGSFKVEDISVVS